MAIAIDRWVQFWTFPIGGNITLVILIAYILVNIGGWGKIRCIQYLFEIENIYQTNVIYNGLLNGNVLKGTIAKYF